MAKNRRIPFGYQMNNGVIVTEPRELYAVSKIFADYLKGKSLLEISRSMQEERIPYHPGEDFGWNKNMVKRILENEKYLGTETYPQLISADIFHRANNKKIKKATNICIVPEELKNIRDITLCAECRKRLFRNQNGTWNCKTQRCSEFEYVATDQMILSAVLNIINSAIANPSLLDAEAEMSVYTPNGEVVKQRNEISRLMDSPDIEYDRIKAAIMELAELKYDCCNYDDVPQKTVLLKEIMKGVKRLNTLDVELLLKCAEYITVSHNATIGLELINGVKLNNITERSRDIGCYDDTCDEESKC
ncbi:recombinase family protein [Ruminococcus sp.]|uniref:recombinase family protein n=1 Tax=Ruminococcus sp. TaxID=41978 RepID=UPI0025E5A0A9|nr:recombinase family protein [Ruminococcus sp.]